jgi:DNA gyrase/topoisomerase IV subunit A
MTSTSDYLGTTSREYATYVMEQRAIPILTDGLKLSQRIALWLIRDWTKADSTIGLVGDMSKSKLYVHGNAAAEDMIGRLAAPYLNNIPLIHGEGAFGTRTAPFEGIGAARYTAVKRSKFAEEELYIDLDICPQRENYDGSKMMPQTFLPRLPLILLNGINGIAIGFANTILPRRLEDIKAAVVEVLKTGKTTHPLVPHYEQYSCEIVQDHSNRLKYYLRGRVNLINTTTVEIVELPPGMALDTIKETMIALEDAGTITGFTDNSTDRISITVKFTRAELTNYGNEGRLITLFKLVEPVTENLTVLNPDGKSVRKYPNVQDMVRDFVEWRLTYYLTRYELLLSQERDVALFWRCFLACFEPPGGGKRSVAALISGIESKSALVDAVSEAIRAHGLELRPSIVERIVGLPVYRFTKEGQDDAKTKLKVSEKMIREYQGIIASPDKRKSIYLNEVSAK